MEPQNKMIINTHRMISFNCKNVVRSIECVRKLCCSAHIVALQETWLFPQDIPFLGSISDKFSYTGKSAVDTSEGVLTGRPHGGVALLWRKDVFPSVSVIQCSSVRLAAIKVKLDNERAILVFSVYMPTNKSENLPFFTECLSEICAIIESSDVESVFILGDFNADPYGLFAKELLVFCAEQKWSCADMELLPSDTHTFVSEAHGTRSWLDHCVVTNAARTSVLNVSVVYDTYWSDHYPILVECNFNVVLPKRTVSSLTCNKVKWGDREPYQIDKYFNYCNSKLRDIDFPSQFCNCADKQCNDESHKLILNKMYLQIVSILSRGAETSYVDRKAKRKYNYVPGWNRHVSSAHKKARECFQAWILHGKPRSGYIYINMCETRKVFKSKLRYCQTNRVQIQMDNLAKHHADKNFSKFWKSTNKLNLRSGLPVTVGDVHEPRDIACLFQRQFKVESSLGPVGQVLGADCRSGAVSVRFSAKNVTSVIKNMVRGKSPGHDDLSIEHLKCAGVHLSRVLAMFFNLCICHNYLPDELMYTVVVPILKNKTGDVSDVTNYRPISLATVIAKVLDRLLDQHLEKHLNLHDAQFGFTPGLSTESAILCLKQTVQYYTARNTPVYACYLDLSKAFDLVNYDKLWLKLHSETRLPVEVISLFRYWYSHQRNTVKWAGVHSDVYGMECGVRQGGLTSPRLFNLYMNRLVEELSSSNVGCSIGGVAINNISYADDMVLLSPSLGGMRKLLRICESYAGAHGLRYNPKKSEYMIFKSGSKIYSLDSPITLCGAPLNRVSKFKYLGHWVTDDLCDNNDIERERRSLSIRCNTLARRFVRCTVSVKATLFKAYCQSFYTCGLWTNYTQSVYGALRVQYNNAFRVLMRLPRFCSASTMFAQAHIDDFYAIIRKRSASLLNRFRGSTNGILSALSERWDSPMVQRWMKLHASSSPFVK
jgi:exonuclease III